MAHYSRLAAVAASLPIVLGLTACSSHDTGGALSGPGSAGTAPVATPPPGPTAAFVADPLACQLLPIPEVTSIIHPPGPLQAVSTVQNAGIFGSHGKCRETTSDGQHGVTLNLYRFPDKAGAAGSFKTFTPGANQVSGLGEQAMRSYDDVFILSGTNVLDLTYVEPFDANMQSDSHQASVTKILVPLGTLALQGLGNVPPYTPPTTTSTTVRSHPTTTRHR